VLTAEIQEVFHEHKGRCGAPRIRRALSTYISTSDGWLYLAVLLDLYSRRVVGWALPDCIDTELALSALRMAISARGLAPGWIHHTDRDGPYGSDDYLSALEQLGATQHERARATASLPFDPGLMDLGSGTGG
jgi:transposase InsO family protein